MESNTEDQLTLFAGGSPAKTYQVPAKEQDSMAKDQAYTARCCELLATVCLDTQFLRMSQDSLLGMTGDGSQDFSMTWPRSGSMQNGTVFQLPTLAHLTKGIGFGLLPTPTVSEGKGVSKNRTKSNNTFSNLTAVFRESKNCPTLMNPHYLELMMGYPVGWTEV